MSLDPGTHLGPHEILGPLGHGGMGEVYRARDSRLGREVAIKVLPVNLGADADRLRRFEQEARAASALNHPNIVTIYEIGQADSIWYISMELVDGKSVKELVAGGPVPLRKLLSIAGQIADGLAKAHAAGIVHRDLKPENLMVSNDGFVKILDFGLAKLVATDPGPVSRAPTLGESTAAGMILGTIGYMSPEQASGRPVDWRSDQFSFGAVLYEMASGRRAFDRETPAETLAAIIRDDPSPLGSANPDLPPPLYWIVERCLAKDVAQRYESTRDLARDLAELRERIAGGFPEAAEPRAANLPVPRTLFVGRDRERAALRDLLLRPDVRLVSLTGPGGIGKTRLSIQVAEDVSGEFAGGVGFVPLASVTTADRVLPAIAQALGLRERPGEGPVEALGERIRALRAPMLIVLDNLEQLGSDAAVAGDVVSLGPNVKLLATSRSPLHVYGEQEFPVPPLGLPDPAALPPVETLTQYEAVALFVQRAAAVKPDFSLTRENGAAIAEICARLDGLPLAIELAAARIKLLAPSAMRSRIEKRLQLLTGGARDLPARQQTLRGAIEWSYDLLSPAEQKLFARLAVFVGGCTLEAVEAVCDARSDLGLDVLAGMESMVDKSLVRSVEPVDGDPRFVMLETIAEYAMERLAASGNEAITRRAHAAYCLVLAEEVGTESSGQGPTGWLERFDLEQDNFRAALDWLTVEGEAEWGLRLGAALFRYWEAREQITEGRDRLARLLALPGAQTRTKARARALFAAGVLASAQRDFATSRPLLAESLEINRERGDKWGAAVSLNALAVVALDSRDVAESRALSEENLALWRDLGDRTAVARSLSNLASVVAVEGDYGRAQDLYEEALSTFLEVGDHTGAARVLNKQGDIAREQKNAEAALSLYERSLAIFRQFGDQWGIAGSLADLGNLARDRGDSETAHSFYRDSLRIFRELDYKRGVAQLLECFAVSAAQTRQARRALRLAGAAAALRQSLGTPLRPSEKTQLERGLAPAREILTGSNSATAWMEGWSTPIDEAIESALEARSGSPV